MSKNTKTLVLLDAHAIIHRAYHALPEFLSSKGEPTGALYGLASMLMKIVTDLKPDYIVACYDLPQKTFRHEAYDAYKAGRAKADEALVLQLINSRQIFDAFGVPIYDAPGFEADDVLGTIVEQIKNRVNTPLQYEGMGYTHPVSSINDGVACSSYKSLPSMKEKLKRVFGSLKSWRINSQKVKDQLRKDWAK